EALRLVANREADRGLREQVQVELARTALRHRPDDDAKNRNCDRGREPRQHLHAAVDRAAPPQPVVGALQGSEVDGAHRAASPCATRRTITWAMVFTTSEKTSRINAR